jgi:phosphotransferase system enzyme I (PtsI)
VIVIQGRGVSAGIVQGRLHCFHRVGAAAVKRAGADPTEECARLAGAQDQAIRQLEALAERCGREVSSEAGMVFSTHAMLLEDESFLEYIKDIINREHCCAEYAVQQAGKTFAATFEAMDDAYMRERGSDVMDVTWRMLRSLAGAGAGGAELGGPAIVAANDLNPTEFIELDRSQVLAIVTQRDSKNSHAAIMARLLHIPAVCNLGSALLADYHGRTAQVDGSAGTLLIF